MLTLDASGNWLEQGRRLPSPNCDERPAGSVIDLLVVHSISLPPGTFGGDGIDRLFTNCLDPAEHPYYREIAGLRVSAHALIDRCGNITQYVSFAMRAWHAGQSEYDGRPACNDVSIGIELEGCDDQPYETTQYETLADLSRLIMKAWPAITPARIVGHADIAPGRKTDPGPTFDWGHYRELLRK